MPDNNTPVRIAFTSCFSTEHFAACQPVWKDIENQKPDVLILLGDSIYIDCPTPFGPDGLPTPPGALSAADFATHVHRLYSKQLAVPEFRQLLNRERLQTYAIWDDHDFLWNDALRTDATRHLQHAIYSSNLFQCWQQALSGQAAFPRTISDPRVNPNIGLAPGQVRYDAAMPGYRAVELWTGGPILHLTDGRSWRDRETLLGKNQRMQIEKTMAKYSGALHLFASGSTVNGKGTSGWTRYPTDLRWLEAIASQFDVVVLSGDIHRNDYPAPRFCGNRRLLEFVASGAAVDFAPSFLKWPPPVRERVRFERHFGLLTLEGGKLVQTQLFEDGQPAKVIDCTV